ncbi:MAG TPA: phospholipase D-like domain-containing protein [Rhodothermales bacterium]|nr:phospholipase D-like domain-containing protein [Rhodothermales bacterium]
MDLPFLPSWIVWVVFIIGLYALIIEGLKVFSAFGREMKAPHTSSSQPGPGTMEFVQALANAVAAPVGTGGTVRILNDGDAFYPALFEEIQNARHSVHIMTYIWRKGELSDRLFGELVRCVERGVEVRVMMDGLGSVFAPRKDVDALRKAGGQIGIFSPLTFAEMIHINHRNHRRAFVIDGRIGFTGGITVADQWLGHAQDTDHWRDLMVEVTGPLAHTLQSTFVQLWINVTGEVLTGPKYYPEIEAPIANPEMLHVGVASSPSSEVQPLLHFFWFTLHTAHTNIYIANAYFCPDRHLRGVLMDKARKGLDVRIMVPGRHTDSPVVRWSSHYFYRSYLEAGIRLFEYQPTMLHLKYMAVDDCWSVTGSANVDIRSVMTNQENLLGIADEDLADHFQNVFLEDMKRCKEITLEDWEKRPWWRHLGEQLAVLFKVQY